MSTKSLVRLKNQEIPNPLSFLSTPGTSVFMMKALSAHSSLRHLHLETSGTHDCVGLERIPTEMMMSSTEEVLLAQHVEKDTELYFP